MKVERPEDSLRPRGGLCGPLSGLVVTEEAVEDVDEDESHRGRWGFVSLGVKSVVLVISKSCVGF